MMRPPPKPCNPRNPNCEPLLSVDGFVFVLFIIAIVYGVYAIRKS